MMTTVIRIRKTNPKTGIVFLITFPASNNAKLNPAKRKEMVYDGRIIGIKRAKRIYQSLVIGSMSWTKEAFSSYKLIDFKNGHRLSF